MSAPSAFASAPSPPPPTPIRIVGTEGHSARPHLAHDAVLASADLVRSLYTLVSQRVSPLVPAVLNVGTIQGGSAKNVIAGECLLEGVIRTLDLDVRERLHGEIRDMADAVARMHHCEAQCVINTGAPPVMNDAGLDAVVSEAAADVIGQENVQRIELPSTGAEDFGMFGIHMPTYMMRLGVRPPGGATHASTRRSSTSTRPRSVTRCASWGAPR